MAIVTGTAGVDFIHRAGDGRVPPQGTNEVTGVTTDSDAISALAGNDIIFGDAGDDAIDGGDGSDSIEGNTGNDIIVAGSGDDLIIWRNGDGSDIVDAGGNIDTQQLVMSDTAGDTAQLFSSGGNAVFQRLNLVPFTITMTNVERFDFQGLSGDDSLSVGNLFGTGISLVSFSGGTGNDVLSASTTLTQISADGAAGDDNLVAGISHDTIFGGDGNDSVFGGGGDDTIYGGAGLDTLSGDDGNDTIVDDAGGSSNISGGAGNDTMYGASGNDYMGGGAGNDTIVGGTDGQDSLYGGDGNDYIVAADSDNSGIGSVLDGGPGSNQIFALIGLGNDYAVGGELADSIATGGGSDFIFGNAGNDSINAGAGTDFIYGNAGNDFIYTDDLVTPSQDFVYVSGLSGFGTGVDTVADFRPGTGGDVAVVLDTPGVTTFADVQARMFDVGVYTAINLSASDQLFLYNVDPGQLTAGNFLFL